MKLFVLLLIRFIGLESREITGHNDTPNGLSESPLLFKDVYAVESHESYRPGEPRPRHHEEREMHRNQESFRDVLSRMSSENVEYYESGNENVQNGHQNLVSDSSSETFTTSSRDRNDKLVSQLLNGPSSSLSDQQNAQSRLVLFKNNTHSSYSKEDNDSTSAETMNNKMDRCDFGVRQPKVAKYLKLGEKVIKENYSHENEQKSSSDKTNDVGLQLNFDVIHDVFETTSSQGGLHAGITYTGKTCSLLAMVFYTIYTCLEKPFSNLLSCQKFLKIYEN